MNVHVSKASRLATLLKHALQYSEDSRCIAQMLLSGASAAVLARYRVVVLCCCSVRIERQHHHKGLDHGNAFCNHLPAVFCRVAFICCVGWPSRVAAAAAVV